LILDRGERQDWFDSPEIVIDAIVAALALYLFLVQITTARQPFLSRDLFRDRNYTVGSVLIFMFGFVLLPPLVLIPIFLQELKDYPVLTVGWVLSPRSLGVMLGMLVGGRLIGRVDPRWVFAVGLVLVAMSGWDMSHWTLSISREHVIASGSLQGIGMGLTYGPLFFLAFLTIPDRLRGEATGFFQLLRNIGSSVAVAIFVFMLFRNTTINRSELIEKINPFNQDLTGSGASWTIDTVAGLRALDHEIGRQAAMIAYNNDYLILTAVALSMIPLAFLFRVQVPKDS
jgi:DHA2 family multidrug resistance protein